MIAPPHKTLNAGGEIPENCSLNRRLDILVVKAGLPIDWSERGSCYLVHNSIMRAIN